MDGKTVTPRIQNSVLQQRCVIFSLKTKMGACWHSCLCSFLPLKWFIEFEWGTKSASPRDRQRLADFTKSKNNRKGTRWDAGIRKDRRKLKPNPLSVVSTWKCDRKIWWSISEKRAGRWVKITHHNTIRWCSDIRVLNSKMLSYTVKTNTRFGECCTCFGCETKTGLVRVLVSFWGRLMFSHII